MISDTYWFAMDRSKGRFVIFSDGTDYTFVEAYGDRASYLRDRFERRILKDFDILHDVDAHIHRIDIDMPETPDDPRPFAEITQTSYSSRSSGTPSDGRSAYHIYGEINSLINEFKKEN